MAARHSHLYEYHKDHGKLVEFSGFEMPVWFEGIIPEHNAVRKSVGIFDTSHMGRVMVRGRDAESLLDSLITNDLSKSGPMEGLYTVICNEEGGIKDDTIVYRLGDERFMTVPNASNREKDFGWITSHAKGRDVEVRDISDDVAMMAVQGPKAEEVLQKMTSTDLGGVKRFRCVETSIAGYDVLAARTGYTGEDGFEIFLWDTPVSQPVKAVDLWRKILEAGKDYGIRPCGLGARDSLRLEAGLSLYGNDIDEHTNPYEARISFVVKLKKGSSFIGREALEKVNKEGVKRLRVGLKMLERGIPRHGYEMSKDGKVIGIVTSGGVLSGVGGGHCYGLCSSRVL